MGKFVPKGPRIYVDIDHMMNMLKIGIRLTNGMMYQQAFAMELWAEASVYQKIHMVQTAFKKNWADEAEMAYALNFLRMQIIQQDKFSNSQMLMANNVLAEEFHKNLKQSDHASYNAVDWKVDSENPAKQFQVVSEYEKYKNAYAGKNKYGGDYKHPAVNSLPGIKAEVTHPVTKAKGPLMSIVINLNDQYKWKREDIADWLETLDVDIRFKPKEVTNEQD